MEIEYKGGNCVTITVKKASIVVDPKISEIGFKDQGGKAQVQLATQSEFAIARRDDMLTIDGPGEYEVENISIRGIPAQVYTDRSDEGQRATIYRLQAGDVNVAVYGHARPDLGEQQLETLGIVDVLILPVGGNGYTLDATGAIKVIRAVEPKIVIPTHYADSAAKYAVPQAELEEFVKELGAPKEVVTKLKLKSDALTNALTIYQIERTS